MSALPTDTKYAAPEFIETYTGRAFYPLRPRVEDVTIIDIAHALSAQPRYSGHTQRPYFTAQHCCLLFDYVMGNGGSPVDGFQILLHDSAEAYLVDIPRPVKQFMPEYRKWDWGVTMAVRRWAGLEKIDIPGWQDELDSRIVTDERTQLFSDSGLDWHHGAREPLGIKIEPWSPIECEQQFLARYAQTALQLFGSPQYLRSGWGAKIAAKLRPADYRTRGGDTLRYGDGSISERPVDLLEVDIRGGVGRVALRSEDGMMLRDTSAGPMPAPAWRWAHGEFILTEAGQ